MLSLDSPILFCSGQVKEVFANTDTANTNTFTLQDPSTRKHECEHVHSGQKHHTPCGTLQDLQLVVDFMDFEDKTWISSSKLTKKGEL